MRRADHRAGVIAQQDRQAVGRQHGAYPARSAREGGIRLGALGGILGAHDGDAMHLGEPEGFGGQMGAQPAATLGEICSRE